MTVTAAQTMIARAICLVLFFATPLFGEVFAQSPATTTTATTSPTAATETAAAPEPWYRVERIFGDVDVGDFVVGPGRSEIEVAPGETVVLEISVTNRISDNRQFNLEVEDISGTNDASRPAQLLGEERGPYSIRDYISFPEDSFTLDLGERARVPVTISVPPDAEPGGYYGSVLVSTVQLQEGGQTGPRQPVIARIGSLIFLTVPGDIVRAGATQDITVIGDAWWHESGPIELGILYENTGSVHLNPYGELSITNMFGEEVGFVELEPWFVLPRSLRLREITWDREFLLGRYTATAQINRGYNDVIDEVSVSFWVLPWRIVLGTFLGLFLIFFAVRAFFRTFEFKRRDS